MQQQHVQWNQLSVKCPIFKDMKQTAGHAGCSHDIEERRDIHGAFDDPELNRNSSQAVLGIQMHVPDLVGSRSELRVQKACQCQSPLLSHALVFPFALAIIGKTANHRNEGLGAGGEVWGNPRRDVKATSGRQSAWWNGSPQVRTGHAVALHHFCPPRPPDVMPH